jgi:hypothetical protein
LKKKTTTTMITDFLNSSGVDCYYQKIYAIVNGKKMSFAFAYQLSLSFKEKDLISWKETTGSDFVDFFKEKIPPEFKISKHRDQDWVKNRLVERYGPDIISHFEKARTTPFYSLVDIAKKYGFSREYSRQLYEKIFGEPFTIAKKDKSKNIAEIGCKYNPKGKVANYKPGSLIYIGAIAEKLFMCRCELLGYKVEMYHNSNIDIVINGFKVDVKSATKCSATTKRYKDKKYWRFQVSCEQLNTCDFFAFYIYDDDSFYILPNDQQHMNNTSKRKVIYISEIKSDYHNAKNKYSEFKNRFDLLETPKGE